MRPDPQPDLLDQRPRAFRARTSEEYFALVRRHDAGEFHICGVELGWVVADTPDKNGRPRSHREPGGYTVRVTYPAPA